MILEIRSTGAAGVSGRRFVIVELQGELQTRTGAPFDGVELGSLQFEAGGVPVLMIGNQRAKGVVEKLPKPVAVLERQSDRCDTDAGSRDEDRASSATESAAPIHKAGDADGRATRTSTPSARSPVAEAAAAAPAAVASTPGDEIRRRSAATTAATNTTTTTITGGAPDQLLNTWFQVVGIVEERLLFKVRPQPVITAL